MTHLPLSGVLDAPTLHQMALPRCGTDDGDSRAAGTRRGSLARRRRRTAQHGEHRHPPGFGVWAAPLPPWARGEAAGGERCSPTGTASSPGHAWRLFLKVFIFSWSLWLDVSSDKGCESCLWENSALWGGVTAAVEARTSPREHSGPRGPTLSCAGRGWHTVKLSPGFADLWDL